MTNHEGSLSFTAPLWPLLLAALVIRCGVLLFHHDNLTHDPDSYRLLAETYVQTGVFGFPQADGQVHPTAFRPPLYPLLLTWAAPTGQMNLQALAVLQGLLSMAGVVVTFLLCRAWSPAAVAWWATLLCACDPLLLHQSTQVMTETLAVLLTVTVLLSLTWWYRSPRLAAAWLSGLLMGLCILCRPTFLLWGACVAPVLLAACTSWRMRCWHTGSFLVGVCLVLSPWVVRNAVQLGHPIVGTTHGGYTLLLGNNPAFYRYVRRGSWGTTWDARELSASDGPDEWTIDRRNYAAARGFIAQEPDMFTFACLFRIGQFLSPLPHALAENETRQMRGLRYMIGLWYSGQFALVLVGAWLVRHQLVRLPWFWGTSLCLVLVFVHAFYWSNLRMRAPLVPLMCWLAACGLVEAAARWRHAKCGKLET